VLSRTCGHGSGDQILVARRWAGFCAFLLVALGATFLTVGTAASEAGPSTLAVSPTMVSNGAEVTVHGTAPCSSVVIDAHPGALGVQSVGPITVRVIDGRFSARLRLPVFAPDPSRPGLDSDQNFNAVCVGGSLPSPTATVRVTGIGLPRTGSNALLLAAAGMGIVLSGVAIMVVTRRAERIYDLA
jgi:LPXTG-motif cell wall-anchored protein